MTRQKHTTYSVPNLLDFLGIGTLPEMPASCRGSEHCKSNSNITLHKTFRTVPNPLGTVSVPRSEPLRNTLAEHLPSCKALHLRGAVAKRPACRWLRTPKRSY
jgi:hypothetical protein